MKVVRYYFADGWRTCLVIEGGRKWIKILPFYPPLKVRKIPLTESRHFKEEQSNGKPYSLSRCKEALKRSARASYGSLRAAPKTVRKALS